MLRLLVVVVLLAGCGAHLRASAGPTVDGDARAGLEVAIEAGTHWLATVTSSAPLAVRAQVAQIGDELVGFVGLATGATAHPAFYGAGPPHPADADRPARRTAGYGGHLSGAIGGSTDDLIGVRIGLGIGHGRGVARRPSRLAFIQWGGEVAWQGDYETSGGEGWTARRHRITASAFVSTWLVPAYDPSLGVSWGSNK